MNHPLPSVEPVFEKKGRGRFRELTEPEQLVFYREVVNRVRANVYINLIDDVDDFTPARNMWMNQADSGMTGYTMEEAYSLGHKLWQEIPGVSGK